MPISALTGPIVVNTEDVQNELLVAVVSPTGAPTVAFWIGSATDGLFTDPNSLTLTGRQLDATGIPSGSEFYLDFAALRRDMSSGRFR